MNLILLCIFSLNVAFIDQATYSKGHITSQNGNYMVVSHYVGDVENYQEEISLFKHDQLVWKQKLDGKHDFYLSNAGASASVLHVGTDAILSFFDERGVVQRTIRISPSLSGNFTKDGKTFFFLSGTEGLSSYSHLGKEMHNFGVCHKYAHSYNGSTVAIIRRNKLTVYKNNIVIMELTPPSMHVRSVVMSDDGMNLALIDNQCLCVYDIQEKCERYRTSIKNPKVLAMSSDGNLIAVAREEHHSTSYINVQLINLDKEVVWEWSKIFDHEYETVHSIRFTDDNQLHIYSTDDLYRFSLE